MRLRLVAVAIAGLIFMGVLPTLASAAQLPDGRGYELVTPPDKSSGAIVLFDRFSELCTSPTGTLRVMFAAGAALAGNTHGSGTVVWATRGEHGWGWEPLGATNGIGELVAVPRTIGYASSCDGTTFALVGDPLVPDDANFAFFPDIYVRRSADSFAWVSRPLDPTTNAFSVVLQGSTPDGRLVYFLSDAPTTTDAMPALSQQQLYVWQDDGGNGSTALVAVKPDGSVDSAGAVLGAGVDGNISPAGTDGAVSADGSRVVFSSPAPAFGTPTDRVRVYVRMPAPTTGTLTTFDTAALAAPGTAEDIQYVGAAADTTQIFLKTSQPLTADDNNALDDIYRFDVPSPGFPAGRLTRMFTATSSATRSGAFIVEAMSADGSAVYYVSQGTLGANGVDGGTNLYVLDHGVTHFIGLLHGADPLSSGGYGSPMQAQATPDGQHFVFTSRANLVGYDPSGHLEVYRYDLATQTLTCVSCPPGAAAATSDASLRMGNRFYEAQERLARVVTDDGSMVFFQTTEALVPQDSNGLQDVYEWHDGAVSLLSSGTGQDGSFFEDATPDGHDVVISTRDTLDPRDVDGGYPDLYDVRVGGGFPYDPLAVPCLGDACQGPLAAEGGPPSPGSMSFTGPGNRKAAGSKPNKHAFSVRPVSRADRLRLAKLNRMTLVVDLSGGGTIRVTATAKLGGRTREVAAVRRTVRQTTPAVAHLPVQLSRVAQRTLRQTHRLAVRLTVHLSGVNRPKQVTLTLRSRG